VVALLSQLVSTRFTRSTHSVTYKQVFSFVDRDTFMRYGPGGVKTLFSQLDATEETLEDEHVPNEDQPGSDSDADVEDDEANAEADGQQLEEEEGVREDVEDGEDDEDSEDGGDEEELDEDAGSDEIADVWGNCVEDEEAAL
jgi:nucleosome binding factor SPN SPT16 subunit